jgi:uncharacterized DUF497 family protein
MEFEWDEDKNAENIRKHGIGFATAVQAFDDDRAIPFSDTDHSTVGEARFALLGMCTAGLVFVSFTIRGEKCRLISARKASKTMYAVYADDI